MVMSERPAPVDLDLGLRPSIGFFALQMRCVPPGLLPGRATGKVPKLICGKLINRFDSNNIRGDSTI